MYAILHGNGWKHDGLILFNAVLQKGNRDDRKADHLSHSEEARKEDQIEDLRQKIQEVCLFSTLSSCF